MHGIAKNTDMETNLKIFPAWKTCQAKIACERARAILNGIGKGIVWGVGWRVYLGHCRCEIPIGGC